MAWWGIAYGVSSNYNWPPGLGSGFDAISAAIRFVSGNITDPYSVTPLLRDLYRFLAPRFMPADTWALIHAKDGALDRNRQYGNIITWYERDNHAA